MWPHTKWLKHRVCVEAWKAKNYEYYLSQKRQLAGRPEYLRRRREAYHAKMALVRKKENDPRSKGGSEDLSTQENNDDTTTTNESADR